jgi:hypothetical protein
MLRNQLEVQTGKVQSGQLHTDQVTENLKKILCAHKKL